MSHLTESQVQEFEKNGYLLVKGVLPREEAEELRRAAKRLVDPETRLGTRVQDPAIPDLFFCNGDLLSKPGLDYIIFDDRILGIMRQLIQGPLVYFGDSNFHVGAGARGFHKDSVDRSDPNGPDWKGNYNILRFGFYLQDHSVHSGGVKVRKGSHHAAGDCETGKSINIPSEIGDMAIWKLTTTHSGNFVRCRLFPWVSLPVRVERNLPEFLRVPEERKRVAVWATFAAEGQHLDRYVQNYIKRGDYNEHWRRSRADQKVLNLAEEKGVKLLKTIPDYGTQYNPYPQDFYRVNRVWHKSMSLAASP